jgi:poly(3-hydroxyalkanoate) depolymerase
MSSPAPAAEPAGPAGQPVRSSTGGSLGPEIMSVRGRALAYRHRPGAPGRVPLLLCNGIGASMDLFDPLVAWLRPERPLIRFEVPGIGASPSPGVPYLLHQLAFTVRTLVARLGYDRVDVLGISWGGGLAQEIALRHHRFCRRLVLVATGTGACMIPARPRVLARMLTPRRHRDPDYARSIAGEIYGGSARHDPRRAVAALHHSLHAPQVLGYLYQLASAALWTSLPWLPAIRQPALVLVLVGADDPIIPHANGVLMARLLGRGELHTYSGGHLTLLTEPHQLAPVIERFLDRPDT